MSKEEQRLRSLESTIGFASASEILKLKPGCFITAYVPESTRAKNQCACERLAADIRYSGLSYIKFHGYHKKEPCEQGFAEPDVIAFCVIDNAFAPHHFKKLAVSWCKKYRQKTVLITNRLEESRKDGLIAFKCVGERYDGDGNLVGGRRDITFPSDIEDYFDEIGKGRFVISSEELVETTGWQVHSFAGRVLGDQKFKSLYPELL